MINKVKPPIVLRLVKSSNETKNELGGQSGESFSRHEPKEQSKESPQPKPLDPVTPFLAAVDESEISKTDEALVSDQVGLTTVVKDWLIEGKTGGTSISKSKASLRYQGDSAPAKGMLLNKKIG